MSNLTIQTPANSLAQGKGAQSLKAILFLLQTHLEQFSATVDQSYDLFTAIGEKTEFAKAIEKMIDNPLENLTGVSNDIDMQLKSILNSIVKKFLQQKISIVDKVLKSEVSKNNLYYSIVLKEDNLENRMEIIDFLSSYDTLNVAAKYPVYFQFIPASLVGKIKCQEEVLLNTATA